MAHPCQAVLGQTESDPTRFYIKPQSGLSDELCALSLTESRPLLVLVVGQGALTKLK